MPVSYKQRIQQGKYAAARKAVKRAYRGAGTRMTRSLGTAYNRTAIMRNRAAMIGTGLPEVKCLDNNTSSAASCFGGSTIVPGNNFTPVALNLIQTGSSFFNRIGRKVRNHSLFIELFAVPNSVANTSIEYHRFLIVYDRQSNGAVPTLSDILNDVDQSNNQTGGGTLVTAHLNMNNRERFVVLMDERKFLPPTASSAPFFTSPVVTTEDTYKIKRFIPLKMLETHYKADSSPAVIGDIATGGLIFVALNGYAAASTGILWTGSIRLKFDDM